METAHRDRILERVPEAKDKVFLLKEYERKTPITDAEGPNIPDPVGQSIDFNKKVFNIIEESIERIAPLI